MLDIRELGSNLDASGSYFWFRRPRPSPSLGAMHRAIAYCTHNAAAFYPCAKRHKASTSKKDLCFDDLGILKVKWNREPTPYVQLVCGRISGALGATCVYLSVAGGGDESKRVTTKK